MITGILAGSFDPVTLGHLDIIQRSLSFCDKLIIGVGINSNKKTFFTEMERIKMIGESVGELIDYGHPFYTKWESKPFFGLLVDFAKEEKANILIRGIRSVADFEYETNLANINKALAPNIETVFLPTNPNLAIVSSSMVKEVAKFGGGISQFVSPHVAKAVQSKFGFVKTGSEDTRKVYYHSPGMISVDIKNGSNCKYPGCTKIAIGGKLGLTMCKEHQPYPANGVDKCLHCGKTDVLKWTDDKSSFQYCRDCGKTVK